MPITKQEIEEQEKLILSDRDRDLFMAALKNPPVLKGKLKSAITKAFVATRPELPLKVDGYYTISSSIIEFASFPESYQQGMPKYPIPAALIGRLAVDNPAKGQGLGTELLVDALLRIIKVSQDIGVFAVRVDALDDSAKEFYLKHEFIPFQERSLSLFLPLETIRKEFC